MAEKVCCIDDAGTYGLLNNGHTYTILSRVTKGAMEYFNLREQPGRLFRSDRFGPAGGADGCTGDDN